MSDVKTRPQCRDDIRHRIGKMTSMDFAIQIGNPSVGVIGDPHPSQPRPTNTEINSALEAIIQEINIKARLGGMDKVETVSIAGQTANGPYRVNLQTDVYAREGQINEVKRVWWFDGTTNMPALRWTSDRDMDANRVDYQSTPPAIPQSVWTTKMGLFILPAPAAAGTLRLYVGRALLGPEDDAGTIEQLPADLFRVPLDGTAWRICVTQTEDQPMASRGPMYKAMYDDGIMDLKTTLGSFGQSNPRLIAQSYRVRRTSR